MRATVQLVVIATFTISAPVLQEAVTIRRHGAHCGREGEAGNDNEKRFELEHVEELWLV
jgi:hypothetical protein